MSSRNFLLALLCAFCVLLTTPAVSQTEAANPTVKAGKYVVTLRLPADGIFAEEETDLEFHVSDASQDDPVQGPPPIVNAVVLAQMTMPAMRSMPAQSPKIHREGVPGDYGAVIFAPHGGDYQLDLTITPPGDKAFNATFSLTAKDADAGRNRKAKPKPYTLTVTTSPASPAAGQPTDLTVHIVSRETGKPVTEYDMVHERRLHFMIVSKDLSYFTHEHPELQPDGSFTLRFTFPNGGEYHLFADVAPKGAGSQVLMQPLVVAGAPAPSVSKIASGKTVDEVGGVRLALQTPASKLIARRTMSVTFTVLDAATNAPITDLQPYLGAMAHLMLIQQDAITFVHCHPDESDPANGHNGSITFLARFPKPGLYKGWLQFQRAGQVQTASFTMTAKETGK